MKVILAAAITIDGFIGKSESDLSTKWTSKEDTKFFFELSKKIKNIVVGSTTFSLFRGKLSERKFYVYSSKNTVKNPHDMDIEVVSEPIVELVDRLGRKGEEAILIAGGSSIYTQFMKLNLVDELYLTVEPVIFGQGVKLFNEILDSKLILQEIIHLSDQTKVLHYEVKHEQN